MTAFWSKCTQLHKRLMRIVSTNKFDVSSSAAQQQIGQVQGSQQAQQQFPGSQAQAQAQQAQQQQGQSIMGGQQGGFLQNGAAGQLAYVSYGTPTWVVPETYSDFEKLVMSEFKKRKLYRLVNQ